MAITEVVPLQALKRKQFVFRAVDAVARTFRTVSHFRRVLCLTLACSAIAAPAGAAAAAGPLVTTLGETGASRGITGFRVKFDRAMDAARADRVGNYVLVGVSGSGRRTRIGLLSAASEAAGRRVKVTTVRPFNQRRFRRLEIRLRGGPGGLTDTRGRRLDGDQNGRAGGDALIRFGLRLGSTLRVRERDGDRATIRLRRGGTIDAIVPIGGPTTLRTQFWILDPIAFRSTLSGVVQQSPSGDGIVVIAEIIGLDKVNTRPLLTNTSFRVNTLTFSSNATGIG
jgi:hypothetical protein